MGLRWVVRVWALIIFALFSFWLVVSSSPAIFVVSLLVTTTASVVWWATYQGAP